MKIPMYIKGDLSHLKCEFGIDKVKIHTDQFEVGSILNWHIKPNTKKAGELRAVETPLFAANGELVCGQGAHINKELYTADIKYNKLLITFNPSKWFNKLVTDADKLAHIFEQIQNDLKETAATEVNLFNSNMSRIDFAAQAQMLKSVPHYDSVIGSAKTSKRAPRKEFPNGFIIGNRSRQLCTYDRGYKDALDSGYKNIQDSNDLRVEARYLTPKALKGQTLFGTAADLLSRPVADMYAAYNRARADLLRIDQRQLQFVEINSLTTLMRHAINSVGKKHALDHIIACLMAANTNRVGPNHIKTAVDELCKEGILSINVANNWHTRYAERLRLVEFHSSIYHREAQANYNDYHQEFRDKFILPYAV